MKATFTRILACVLALALCLLAVGCGGGDQKAADKKAAPKEIRVGVTAGPQAEVMDVVAKEAAKQGLTIKVVEFNDYVTPDKALNEGDLEMNSMQHMPFLENMVKKQGMKLAPIGKTILLPMAMYSEKLKSVDALPDGAKVVIPNDPSNGGRALLLLQQAKLIKLKDPKNIISSVSDIVENPKKIQIIELEAAQVPRALKDCDAACVNANYAIPAGLNPLKDSLLVEGKDNPYVCVLAVREADKANETYLKVAKVYNSEPVRKFIEEKYQGSVLPGF